MDGQWFEIKILTLLLLKALNSGREFQLASNVEGAGTWDDILMRVKPLNDSRSGWETYFISVTHRLRTKITSSSLTSRGNFDLVRGFESYLAIMNVMASKLGGKLFDGEIENCHFVKFTNAKISTEMERRKLRDSSSEVDEIVKTGSDTEFIFGLSDCPEIVSCLEGQEQQEREHFIQKLKVFSGEPREEEMDSIIEEEILKSCQVTISEVKRITHFVIEELAEWWKSSNKVLDQNCDILKMAECKSRLEHLEQMQTKELTMDSTFNKSSSTESLANAVNESKFLLHVVPADTAVKVTCSKLLQVLRGMRLPFLFTGLECFIREKDTFMSGWKSKPQHLLVITTNTKQMASDFEFISEIYKVIVEDENKKVVFISPLDDVFAARLKEKLGGRFTQVQDSFKLSQLTDESLKKALKAKVLFQGQEVEKGELIGLIDASEEHTPQLVNFVANPEIEAIGQTPHQLPRVYIERTLKRQNYLTTSIFQSKPARAKYAVSGLTVFELKELTAMTSSEGMEVEMKTESSFLVLNQKNPETHFGKLCVEFPTVHWLHMEDGQLMWRKSHGSVSEIFQYIDEDKYSSYRPNTCLDLEDRAILLVSEPGMGKSYFLTHLARLTNELNPLDWIVQISLNDHAHLLDSTLCKEFKVEEFLTSVACVDKTSLNEKVLFQQCLKNNGNVIVILDGFDEIAESCVGNCKLLLEYLLKTKAKKVWVSSRQSRGKMLERWLSTIAFSLEAFTLVDQRRYLEAQWSGVETTLSKRQQKEFIDILLNTRKHDLYTSTPLHTMMLAEVFQSNLGNPKNVDLLSLYEMFVKQKYRMAYEEKNKVMLHTNMQKFTYFNEKLNAKHVAASLVTLFDADILNQLHDKNIQDVCADLIGDVISGNDKSGMVDNITNGKPHFIHKIFPEFYAGTWLADNHQQNKTFFQTQLYREEFRGLRKFYDLKLARDCPLHTAVLNYDMVAIESSLTPGADVNSRDRGGRTALHLAATIGFNAHESRSFGCNNKSIVEILLDRGANITLPDTGVLQWTPLHAACSNGRLSVVQYLLEYISDDKEAVTQYLNARDVNECTALHLASQHGHVDVVRLLVSVGGVLESRGNMGQTLLHAACSNGHISMVQYLLENISKDKEVVFLYVNARDDNKCTALHLASQHGHVDVVRLLVSVGADKWSLDSMGQSSLHKASSNGHLSITKILLENISEENTEYVNVRDVNECTALHLASEHCHVDIVYLLISAGAK